MPSLWLGIEINNELKQTRQFRGINISKWYLDDLDGGNCVQMANAGSLIGLNYAPVWDTVDCSQKKYTLCEKICKNCENKTVETNGEFTILSSSKI
jgi:hypothetical protein